MTTTFVALPPDGLPTIDKAPQSVLDYGFDWTSWLGADTIAAYAVTVSGVTKGADSRNGAVVTVWISGGVVGTPARVTCEVTTAAGRTERRSFGLRITER